MKPFKSCACGVEYQTKEELISKCEFVDNWDRFGLALYNCECKSTITIEIFEGSKALAKEQIKMDREQSKGTI